MSQKPPNNHDVRVLILLLACAGVIVMGCLVLNGFTWARLQKSAQEQSVALDRLAQYSAVLSTLQDVELGQRGYVISGDEHHLEVFNSARKKFAKEWEKLVVLEAEDGRAEEQIQKLREASDRLIRYAIEIVFVRERLSNTAAEKEFTEGRPKSAMREVRDLYAAEMKSVENTIRERSIAANDDFQAGLATSMAMGVLALGIGGIAIVLLRRVLKEIKRSERYALSMLKSEETRRQKDVFLAMMSHEIRTPLNAIIGFGQLAQKEEMGDKGKRYVKSILEGGKSLLLLINDILDLSKLQAGRMELKLEPTHPKDMLDFMERLFQESCASKGVRFRLDYQEDLPQALILDSIRLRQILMNLIGNAVKFTDSGEVSVTVRGNPEPDHSSKWSLTIEVVDTGPGIPEEDISHIFEPFYQSNEPKARKVKGTGLGLSIVQRFVKLMHGELKVLSTPGEGTRFTVQLRNLDVSARIVTDHSIADESVDFNKLRASKILAVDDNSTNRALIREIFAGTHHEVTTASDGDEAIERVSQDKPDLVLMDLRMPGKDGPTAAHEIKTDSEYRLTPIIAVTAGSLPSADDDSPLLGTSFDGALRKPFTRREMFAALAQFLKQQDEQKMEQETVVDESGDPGEVSDELLRELDELLSERWADVKSGMTISEVSGFGDDLDVLAGQHSCERLKNYVDNLKESIASLSFGDMESVLGRYPDLVAELKESRAS